MNVFPYGIFRKRKICEQNVRIASTSSCLAMTKEDVWITSPMARNDEARICGSTIRAGESLRANSVACPFGACTNCVLHV